jgi:hypothetical protein
VLKSLGELSEFLKPSYWLRKIMSKKKVKAPDKDIITKSWQRVIDKIEKFMGTMKESEVKMSIQFTVDTYTTHITNMNPIEVLGAIEYAKSITLSGLSTHQSFDNLVQTLEARPDLLKRYTKVVDKLDVN